MKRGRVLVVVMAFFSLFLYFFTSKDVYADNLSLSNPNRSCVIDVGNNRSCSSPGVSSASWWDQAFFESTYHLGDFGSGGNIYKSIQFEWDNIGLCTGKSILIKGSVGGLTGFFSNNYEIHVYNGGSEMNCSFTQVDTSRVDFTCSGIGGGSFYIYVNQNNFIPSTVYQIGVSKVVDITCSSTTDDVISSAEQNTQDIINNQNQNHQQTNDKLDEVNEINKNIFEAILDLPNTIVNLILDGLSSLFIPSDDFLQNWFTEMQESLEEQLGFLSYPTTWIITILQRFMTLEDTGSYVLSWGNINVPLFNLPIIQAGLFDLATLLENDTLNTFHEIYFMVLNALTLLAFMGLCMNTYNRIFGGDQDNYTYLSVENSYDVDPSTGEVLTQHTRERESRRVKNR